ncbi:hypothetical protein J6590_051368 [Homalodisca vitripennis]|nr:hypothetical protein J6590_051368 [Homalodisca vitripennis]
MAVLPHTVRHLKVGAGGVRVGRRRSGATRGRFPAVSKRQQSVIGEDVSPVDVQAVFGSIDGSPASSSCPAIIRLQQSAGSPGGLAGERSWRCRTNVGNDALLQEFEYAAVDTNRNVVRPAIKML